MEISCNDKTWKNMLVTSSPRQKGSYIELKVNPNGNSKKKSYIQKQVRIDKIGTRGELLKKYKLSNEDFKEIKKFILSRKNKKR